MQNDIETDETNRLIASNKVEGTSVYNPSGEKLGSIYNFMVAPHGTTRIAVFSSARAMNCGRGWATRMRAVAASAIIGDADPKAMSARTSASARTSTIALPTMSGSTRRKSR